MKNSSKIILLSLPLYLMGVTVQADYYDNAMSAWSQFKKTNPLGKKSDILDFLETQDDPHIIAATTATGLDVGITKNPSIERVNRLLGILARKLKNTSESAEDLQDQKNYVKSVKDHQFQVFQTFWQRLQMGDFSFETIKIADIRKKIGRQDIYLTQSGQFLIGDPKGHITINEMDESNLSGFVWRGKFDPVTYRKIYQEFPWLDTFDYKVQSGSTGQDVASLLLNVREFDQMDLDISTSVTLSAPVKVSAQQLNIRGEGDLTRFLKADSKIKSLSLMGRSKKVLSVAEIALIGKIHDASILEEFITDDQACEATIKSTKLSLPWKIKKSNTF